MGEKKRGRPKGPCNPKELAQRRGAAFKHGARASTALRQSVHPCRDDLCPLGNRDSCTMKQAVEERGGAMETCLPRLGLDPHVQTAYLDALKDGKKEGVLQLVAASMGGLHQFQLDQLEQLINEDLVLFEEIKDDKGNVVSTKPVANPRASPLLEMFKVLGHTGAEQHLTPKSRGDQAAQQSVSDHLTFMQEFARKVAP